ncbi:transposase [Kitasatospora atroaurantiaca]|uniref:Transposase n=1 Tax=Kitasatospora atroaurantiaca TaxID=285545 RepID=A0A561F252_9ACTN|nr:transposase [Kitasatospora atroaurantiaca]TWE21943.1 transposase [Kitasatospora atroaurantiaca]
MDKRFRTFDPHQVLLLPPSLDDWLPEDHLARFVADLVDQALDLSPILADYTEKRGYPPYDPRLMVRLLIYGYTTGVRSSRAIERRCVDDVAFRFLAADQAPDFRSIARFRRRHLDALADLFLQSLHLAQRPGMVKMGRVALDGTKLEANASKHKAMSYGRLVDKEERIEAEIAHLEAKAAALLADAEATDTAEDERFGPDGKEVDLPAELDRREKRLARLQAARAQIEAEAADKARKHAEAKERRRQARAGTSDEQAAADAGEKAAKAARPKPKAQANFTDPDSRIMKNSDGAYIQAYNAQAVVDEAHQVVTAADVTTNASDALNYTAMLDQSATNTGLHPKAGPRRRRILLRDQPRSRERPPTCLRHRNVHGHRPARPRRAGPTRAPRTHPQERHARGAHGPQAADQARTEGLQPPQGHRRTRLRADHDLPERPPAPPTRRGRRPRRVAFARRLPQLPQGLPTRRHRRTRRGDRLTGPGHRPPRATSPADRTGHPRGRHRPGDHNRPRRPRSPGQFPVTGTRS